MADKDNLIRGKFEDHRPFEDRFLDQLFEAAGRPFEPEPEVDADSLSPEGLRFADSSQFFQRAVSIAVFVAEQRDEPAAEFLGPVISLRDRMWSQLSDREFRLAEAMVQTQCSPTE